MPPLGARNHPSKIEPVSVGAAGRGMVEFWAAPTESTALPPSESKVMRSKPLVGVHWAYRVTEAVRV